MTFATLTAMLPLDGRHDIDGVTVRLVREPDGSGYLVMFTNAAAWVIRKRWLHPQDLN